MFLRLAYPFRNTLIVWSLLTLPVACVLLGWQLLHTMAKEQVADPTLNGESGGFLVLILWGLALYTLPFGLGALLWMRRRSAPIPGWVLVLGLLPTMLLGLFFLWLFRTELV